VGATHTHHSGCCECISKSQSTSGTAPGFNFLWLPRALCNRIISWVEDGVTLNPQQCYVPLTPMLIGSAFMTAKITHYPLCILTHNNVLHLNSHFYLDAFIAPGSRSTERTAPVALHCIRPGRGWRGTRGIRGCPGQSEGHQR